MTATPFDFKTFDLRLLVSYKKTELLYEMKLGGVNPFVWEAFAFYRFKAKCPLASLPSSSCNVNQ